MGGAHYCGGWQIDYEASPVQHYCGHYNEYVNSTIGGTVAIRTGWG